MLTSTFFHLHLNYLSFTNCDCMPTFAISLQHILHFLHWSWLFFTLKPFLPFPSPIVITCQPSLYHCTYYISFISLDCVFYLETFPSPVVIVCQPLSYRCSYYISFIGLDCVLPWRLSSLHQSWLYANLCRIIAYTTFPSLVLIVFYLEAFLSLHQLWLYCNIHCIIAHTTIPSLVLIVSYLEGFSSFHQSWLYANLHPIIAQTFPSLVLIVFYLHCIIVYTAFPSLVLIVCYLEALPSLYQSWLYASLHRIIAHTAFPSFVLIVFYVPSNYLSFTNRDCMPTYCTACWPWLLVVLWSDSLI